MDRWRASYIQTRTSTGRLEVSLINRGQSHVHSQLLLVIDLDEHLRARGGRSNVELCCRKSPSDTSMTDGPNHNPTRTPSSEGRQTAHGEQKERRRESERRGEGVRTRRRVRCLPSTQSTMTLSTTTCPRLYILSLPPASAPCSSPKPQTRVGLSRPCISQACPNQPLTATANNAPSC